MNDIYADFIIIIRIYYYCTYVSMYLYIYIVYINNYLYDNSILYIGYIMSIIIILLCGGGGYYMLAYYKYKYCKNTQLHQNFVHSYNTRGAVRNNILFSYFI